MMKHSIGIILLLLLLLQITIKYYHFWLRCSNSLKRARSLGQVYWIPFIMIIIIIDYDYCRKGLFDVTRYTLFCNRSMIIMQKKSRWKCAVREECVKGHVTSIELSHFACSKYRLALVKNSINVGMDSCPNGPWKWLLQSNRHSRAHIVCIFI